MTRKSLQLILVCAFSLTSIVLFGHSTGQSQSDVPLVYYYSTSESAFIVEDANGENRWELVEYQRPQERFDVYGPGWSPSGRWFAWTINDPSGGLSPDSVAFLVDRDGGNVRSIVVEVFEPEGGSSVSMVWSPSEDILLVHHVVSTIEKTIVDEIFLYDANTGVRIATLSGSGLFIHSLGWTPNGEYALLYFTERTGGTQPFSMMRLVSRDGKSIEDRQTRILDGEFCPDSLPDWSNESQAAFVHPSEEAIVVEDFSTKRVLEVSTPSMDPIRFVDINSDGSYALLYTAIACKEGIYDLWLLSISDGQLEMVTADAWLPLSYAQNRFPTDIYELAPSTAWLTNSRAFVISDGIPLSLNTRPFQITKFDPPIDGETHLIYPSPSAERAAFIWYPENASAGYSLYIYDVNENEFEIEVSGIRTPINYAAFSHNDEYLTYIVSGTVYVITSTGRLQTEVSLLNETYPGTIIGGSEVIWHSQKDWFLLLGYTGLFRRIVNIVDSEGVVQREVGECSISPSCFGWLPRVAN